MKRYTLGKEHKLCAKVAVDRLFGDTGCTRTAMAYPLRAVWAENAGRERGAAVQFMITVPKKRLRHAVDRVTARRRVREAYRLNRNDAVMAERNVPVDIAFIYISNSMEPYARIEKSMRRLLDRIFPSAESGANSPTIE